MNFECRCFQNSHLHVQNVVIPIVNEWRMRTRTRRRTQGCFNLHLLCRYDKVVCVGSLPKAFGMPGLRVGWLVAPEPLLQAAWRRHEYAAISTSSLSMHLAEHALQVAFSP